MATVKKNVKAVAKAEPKKVAKVEPVKEETTRAKQVKAIDFVPVFQNAESAAEVAEHFGRDAMWVSSFASRLRAMGVKLKKMPRGQGLAGGKRLDIDELNALIED